MIPKSCHKRLREILQFEDRGCVQVRERPFYFHQKTETKIKLINTHSCHSLTFYLSSLNVKKFIFGSIASQKSSFVVQLSTLPFLRNYTIMKKKPSLNTISSLSS